MLVNWTYGDVNIVPLSKLDARGIARPVGQYTLLPGINDIPENKWEQIKLGVKNSPYQGFLKVVKSKIVEVEKEVEEVVKNKTTGKTEKKKIKKKVKEEKAISFDKIDNDEALALIDECYNLETLEMWRKLDIEKNIKNAIDEKAEAINTGKKRGKK